MDKKKDSKRQDDDQSREPGRHSQAPAQAPEPERRYPDSNRPDTLRPGPGERERKGEGERKEGARQSDESRMVSVEDDDEVEAADDDDEDDEVDAADDDEGIDDEEIDDEAVPAKPVK